MLNKQVYFLEAEVQDRGFHTDLTSVHIKYGTVISYDDKEALIEVPTWFFTKRTLIPLKRVFTKRSEAEEYLTQVLT